MMGEKSGKEKVRERAGTLSYSLEIRLLEYQQESVGARLTAHANL